MVFKNTIYIYSSSPVNTPLVNQAETTNGPCFTLQVKSHKLTLSLAYLVIESNVDYSQYAIYQLYHGKDKYSNHICLLDIYPLDWIFICLYKCSPYGKYCRSFWTHYPDTESTSICSSSLMKQHMPIV